MYRANRVIYTIITISITLYFSQSLPVPHIHTGARTLIESIRTRHTGSMIRTRECPNKSVSDVTIVYVVFLC